MKLKIAPILATLFLCSSPTFAVVLSIEDCVDMVLATDQSVLAAQYALDEAHGNLLYAKSKFFPSFSLSASMTKLSNVPYTVIPAGIFGPDEIKMTMGTDESVSLGATLVQPLWMGEGSTTAMSWRRLANRWRRRESVLLGAKWSIPCVRHFTVCFWPRN